MRKPSVACARTCRVSFLNPACPLSFRSLLGINPLIKLDRRRIALTAAAAAGGAGRQFAEVALADPFAEHAAQGVGIDVEMVGQVEQRDAALRFDVVAQVRQDQRRLLC